MTVASDTAKLIAQANMVARTERLAAVEIARLEAALEAAEAERDRLREALARRVEECCCEDDGDLMCVWCVDDRAALAGSGE